MKYERNAGSDVMETPACAILRLPLKHETQEFRLEFQSCRKVTPEQVWVEGDPYILGKKDLLDYTYTYNGRTYRDVRGLNVEIVEELSKSAYIARDIHGEKSLMTYTAHPACDLTGPNNDIQVLVYLIFDGKNVHMIVMQGLGSIAGLAFYDNLLNADVRLRPYFEKLGWPMEGIAWT